MQHDWFRVGGAVQGRPIAVFLGWVGATAAGLKRYAEVYNKFGWDVLAFRLPFLSLWFPHWAFSNAVDVLDCIMQEFVRNGPRQIIFVVYSGAAKMCYYRLLEILGGKHKQQDFCCLYSAVKDNCIGQVYDSSPVDFTSQAGVSFLTAQQQGLLNAVKKSGASFAAGCLDFFLVEWFEKDRQNMWDVLSHPPVAGPLLFLYSLGDHVADAAMVRTMAAAVRGRGRTVVEQVWPDAPHMRLLQTHPAEYVDAVGYFLGLLPSPGPSGQNTSSPGSGGGHSLSGGADVARAREQAGVGTDDMESVDERASAHSGSAGGVVHRSSRAPSHDSMVDRSSSGNVSSARGRSGSETHGVGDSAVKSVMGVKVRASSKPARLDSVRRERGQRHNGVVTDMLCGFEEQLLRSCGAASVAGGLPADALLHRSGLCSRRSTPVETVVWERGAPVSSAKTSSPKHVRADSATSSMTHADSATLASQDGRRRGVPGAGGWGRAWRGRWLGSMPGWSAKVGMGPEPGMMTGGSTMGRPQHAGPHDKSGDICGTAGSGTTGALDHGGHGLLLESVGYSGRVTEGDKEGGAGRAVGSTRRLGDGHLVQMTDGLVTRPVVQLQHPDSRRYEAVHDQHTHRPHIPNEVVRMTAGLNRSSLADDFNEHPDVCRSQQDNTADCYSSVNPLHAAAERLRLALHHTAHPSAHSRVPHNARPYQRPVSPSAHSSAQLTGSSSHSVLQQRDTHTPSVPHQHTRPSYSHQGVTSTSTSRPSEFARPSAASSLLHDDRCPWYHDSSSTCPGLSQRPSNIHVKYPGQDQASSEQGKRWLNWPGAAFVMHQRPLSKL